MAAAVEHPWTVQGETVLLQSNVEYTRKRKKDKGTLFLTTRRIVWYQQAATKPTVSLPFSHVTSVKVSKRWRGETESQAYMRVYPSEKVSDTPFDFVFVSNNKWDEREAFKSLEETLRQRRMQRSTSGSGGGSSGGSGGGSGTGDGACASPLPNGATPVPADVVRRRAALLARNPELRLVHDALVASGSQRGATLTEDEFWASHEDEVVNEDLRAVSQQQGMPSALVADVRPTMETGTEVHYKLTPTIIRQIFTEYPGVREAYEDQVPDKMNEIKFWSTYFQSAYFRGDLLRRGGGTIAAAGDDASGGGMSAADDIFARYQEEDQRVDESGGTSLVKLLGSDAAAAQPDVDLTGAEDDLAPGYGLYNTETTATRAKGSGGHLAGSVLPAKEMDLQQRRSLSLIRRYNRHGTLVLTASSAKQAAGGGTGGNPVGSGGTKRSRGDAVEGGKAGAVAAAAAADEGVHGDELWSDLHGGDDVEVVELRIQDRSRYFEGHASAAGGNGRRRHVWGSMPLEQLTQGLARLGQDGGAGAPHSVAAVFPPRAAGGAAVQASVEKASSHRHGEWTGKQEGDLQLSSECRMRVGQAFAKGNELLRHFWACYPITSPHAAAKAKRMNLAIDRLYDTIDAERKVDRSNPTAFFHLTGPLLATLEHAITHYRSYKQQRE